MPYPSLVLWNGNNENLWGFVDWDWKPELDGASWGEGYYLQLLPKIVAETDIARPYWAGTPWSGSWEHHPNHPDHGTVHSWEVWNRLDYRSYLDDIPRFVAEFGWQAPPNVATLRQALSDEPFAPDSPGMLHHQKADDGNGKLARGLERHFAVPTDFEDWHWLTQLNQVRAVATGVEHWRSHWPRCTGTILWQLNDCWPVTSWAAIDGGGRPKPLWYELRRLYADRLLTFQQREGRTVLVVINHSANPWDGTALLRRVDADGTTRARQVAPIHVSARSVVTIALPDDIIELTDPRREFCVADADGLRALHFDCTDVEFAYAPADMDIRTSADDDDHLEIAITARSLIRDLFLHADRLAPGAETDRGLITLLPGEEVTFTVTGSGLRGQELPSKVLRCVNESGLLASAGLRKQTAAPV